MDVENAHIARCQAFLDQHHISSVLETCISAVLGQDADDLVLALADELDNIAQKGSIVAAPAPIPAHRVPAAKARMQTADLERAVGAAVSSIIADMPPQPFSELARNLRASSLGAGRDQDGAAAATRQWSQLVAQGWANAASLSLGHAGKGAGSSDEQELLVRVSRQVDALSGLESALSTLELLACQHRMQSLCADLKLCSAQLKAVPPHYYSLTYEQRRHLLEAPSTAHLCKTIILENTAWDAGLGKGALGETEEGFPTNARYYGIIVQYEAKLHADKVLRLVRSWTQGAPKSKFNFQLCPEGVSAELTGYKHNAVAPLGYKTAIPMILSHRIAELQPCFMWLGGERSQVFCLGLGIEALGFRGEAWRCFVWLGGEVSYRCSGGRGAGEEGRVSVHMQGAQRG